jgi:DNA-binding transcriptional LysR family regulator
VLDAVREGKSGGRDRQALAADQNLEFVELMQDRMMFVAPAGHATAKLRPTLKAADKFDLVLMRAGPTEFALRARGDRDGTDST